MNILDMYLAQLGKAPYSLKTASGAIECVVTESRSGPYYLTWYENDPQTLACGFDVHEVQNINQQDWVCILGGYTVKRVSPNDPWIYVSRQEFYRANRQEGYPIFPVNINEGDNGVVTTAGDWTWTKYDETPAANVVGTGAGTFTDVNSWMLFAGRFVWEENYTEMSPGKAPVNVDRVAFYDVNGMMGFISKDSPTSTCWRV